MSKWSAEAICSRHGLPPRKPTVLATYSRRSKLLVTAAVFLAVAPISASSYWMGGAFIDGVVALFTPSDPAKLPNDSGWMPPESVAVIPEPIRPAKVQDDAKPISYPANDDDTNIVMKPAPDPSLIESSNGVSLPCIGKDGRTPWQEYARPFDSQDPRPRIAVVVTGLGFSQNVIDTAIHRLPSAVTLTFSANGPLLKEGMLAARAAKHETILSIPVEPNDYPSSDPGDKTLLAVLPTDENVQRLFMAMQMNSGYVGVTYDGNNRFTTVPAQTQALQQVLQQRGLLIFDPVIRENPLKAAEHQVIPTVAPTSYIDAIPRQDAIEQALAEAEQVALKTGRAVVVASPLPVTLDVLAVWAHNLTSRGIVIAPVSAMVD